MFYILQREEFIQAVCPSAKALFHAIRIDRLRLSLSESPPTPDELEYCVTVAEPTGIRFQIYLNPDTLEQWEPGFAGHLDDLTALFTPEEMLDFGRLLETLHPDSVK